VAGHHLVEVLPVHVPARGHLPEVADAFSPQSALLGGERCRQQYGCQHGNHSQDGEQFSERERPDGAALPPAGRRHLVQERFFHGLYPAIASTLPGNMAQKGMVVGLTAARATLRNGN
jgi:hypothetical protein